MSIRHPLHRIISAHLLPCTAAAVACFGLTSFAYAAPATADHPKVACPAASSIQRMSAHLNRVESHREGFAVITSQPYPVPENQVHWYVGTMVSDAASKEEALVLGKQAVKNTASLDAPYADDTMGAYVCSYDNETVFGISLFEGYKNAALVPAILKSRA